MDKLFNISSIVGGIVGGFLCNLFGGYDVILKALIAFIVLDYITGVLKAIYTKTVSSETGFKGLIRKFLILIVVVVAVIIENVLGGAVPIREITIIFFLCNEGISLLENAAEFIPIPEKLKAIFIQIRDKNIKAENEEDSDDE